VLGLDDAEAHTWTRKLKEYFELLCPTKNFHAYFNRVDSRGDIILGKLNGPDNLQVEILL
jgi:hypothetical protein